MSPSDPVKIDQPADDFHVVVRGNAKSFLQNVSVGSHHLQADEPTTVGGSGAAPDPYDYLLAGLGACTSRTVGLYARKRKWPLEDVTVSLRHSRIHAKDCEDCETKDGLLHQIEVQVAMTGPLTAEQHTALMAVAGKCPVHQALTSEIKIRLTDATKPVAS